jgi:transcriptional regulator with XRE-family HTH domain
MSELPDADTFEADGADVACAVGGRSIENARLRQVVAERLIEARALCGLDQGGAAQRMGYTNSTQICLWEQAKRLPPHNVLLRCADVYGVSLDYLLGRCDSPESDELLAGRNAMLRHAAGLIEHHATDVAALVSHYLSTGAPAVLASGNLLHRIGRAITAIEGFQHLNEQIFDDLRGGASLLHALRLLGESANEARILALGSSRAITRAVP